MLLIAPPSTINVNFEGSILGDGEGGGDDNDSRLDAVFIGMAGKHSSSISTTAKSRGELNHSKVRMSQNQEEN